MTIVLPKDYHARTALEKSRILCITQEQALKEDIRALRIGILNIMPRAETYEFSLLHPLGRSVLQIEPVWIRLKTHEYNSTDQAHLEKLYMHFEDAVELHLDGLIVTGAPVEETFYALVTKLGDIDVDNDSLDVDKETHLKGHRVDTSGRSVNIGSRLIQGGGA